jgi:hypothetical protein
MAEEQIKFDNQEFLSTYLDQIISQMYSTSDKFSYSHIYKLDTTADSLPVSIAKLTGKSESVCLNRMRSYQYASLVPKIRLYRVQGSGPEQKEFEFKFGKSTQYLSVSDDSNILGTPRGNNCGIVSAEYKLAGTNPVTAERFVEVVLEFHFDSINSFSGGNYDKMLEFWKKASAFSEEPSNIFDDVKAKTTTNYWSLIMHPNYKKENNNKYKSEDFRIKAVIGWESLEPSLKQELFSELGTIDEDLSDTNLSVTLQLTNHHFTFNEDGSLKLKAEYIGSLENVFTTKKFNIFKGLKESIEDLKIKSVTGETNGDTLVGQQNKVKLLNYLKENKDLSKLINEANSCVDPASGKYGPLDLSIDLSNLNTTSPEALNKLIEQENTKLDSIRASVDRSILSVKQQYYQKLSENIIKTSNIKTLTVDNNTAKEWLRYRNKKPGSSLPSLTVNIQESNANDTEIVKAKQQLQENRDKQVANLDKEKSEGVIATISSLWNSLPFNSTEPAEADTLSEDLKINFTTIGAIIDAVYEILIAQDPNSEDAKEVSRNLVILSSFTEEQVSLGNGGAISKNIADIPIAISKLTEFLLKNVEEPQKDTYTMKEFLRDVMSQFIETSLNSRNLGETEENKYANTSLAFNTFTLKGITNPIDEFKLQGTTSSNDITTFNKTKKDIRQYYPIGTLSEGESYYNYFLIYDKYLKDFYGNGNKIEDEQKGIYHFSIGQDYGLLKQVNFKRVDQPGLREAKSLGKETLFLGQFRDRYNADLTLFGNNIFTPGMLVFITPSVEIGNPADPDSFSEITGIGGYYTVISVNSRITQGEYMTTLDCVFHSARGTRSDKKKKECSFAELEKAGLINPDGQLTSTINELKSLSEEVQKVIQKSIEEQEKLQDKATTPSIGRRGG